MKELTPASSSALWSLLKALGVTSAIIDQHGLIDEILELKKSAISINYDLVRMVRTNLMRRGKRHKRIYDSGWYDEDATE